MRGAFSIVEASDGLLLGHVPDDQQVICAGAGEHLGVVWTPRDGRDGLLVLGHDGAQLEFVVPVVQLNGQRHQKGNCSNEMKEIHQMLK